MDKIYLITESTWDHHQNVRAYSTKEKALQWCNSQYGAQRPDWRGDPMWKSGGYQYWIEELEIDDE